MTDFRKHAEILRGYHNPTKQEYSRTIDAAANLCERMARGELVERDEPTYRWIAKAKELDAENERLRQEAERWEERWRKSAGAGVAKIVSNEDLTAENKRLDKARLEAFNSAIHYRGQADELLTENERLCKRVAELEAADKRVRALIAECDELEDVRVDVDQLQGAIGGYFK